MWHWSDNIPVPTSSFDSDSGSVTFDSNNLSESTAVSVSFCWHNIEQTEF